MNQPVVNSTSKNVFEELKQVHDDTECWDARELMAVAGYEKWENFNFAIEKAMTACKTNNETVDKHFFLIPGKNTGGKGRPGINYLLTRTACYYIFQNGDPTKPEIAGAQAYFILQTRLQEISQQDRLDARRVNLHNKVLSSEDNLTQIATMHHRLTSPQEMHNAGSEGLYNRTVDEVEYLKGIEEGQLYHHIDSPELAAHYFRITQTEVQLENDAFDGHIYDQEGLEEVAKGVGMSVRSVMRESNRTLPELLPAAPDIQPLKERLSGRDLELMEKAVTPQEPPKDKQINPPVQAPLFTDDPFAN